MARPLPLQCQGKQKKEEHQPRNQQQQATDQASSSSGRRLPPLLDAHRFPFRHNPIIGVTRGAGYTSITSGFSRKKSEVRSQKPEGDPDFADATDLGMTRPMNGKEREIGVRPAAIGSCS